MPTPSSTLATQRPDLQTFYQYDYAESERYTIGAQLLPIMTVPKQAGNFGKVTLESFVEHQTDTARAVGTGYARRRYEFTDDSYATSEQGIEEVLDDREVAMYSDYLDAEMMATARARNTILTRQEKRIRDAVLDVSFYTGDAAYNEAVNNGKWDVANSTPVLDVETAWRKFRDNTGIRPNAMVINEYTFRDLRNHAEILARIAAEGAGDKIRAEDVSVEHLQRVFGIPRILVGGAMENTANPGQSATMADVWPNHAFITKIATTNDMREPCIGRTFHWSEDGSRIDGLVETYREEQTRSEVIRVRHETQEKILYQELGVLIPSVRG